MPKNMPKSQTPDRKPGRPRTSEPGSKAVFTTLGPSVLSDLEDLAATERRSQSAMVAILIEEALRARKGAR